MDPIQFQKAKGILLHALSLEASARDGYLDEACQGDARLRCEVESLLAQEIHPMSILDAGILGDAARVGAALEEMQHCTIPARIGAYDILDVLGQGGMGVVYRARQRQPIEREVALKVIRRGLVSPSLLARFDWERRSLARMDHPHIASVYDAGTDDDGQPYVAMQLAVGKPITDFCDSRTLGVRARIELFLDVCRAVQHAHDRGVIHRDLKPSNIIVREVDGKLSPLVIDFGIAKALVPDLLVDDSGLTMDGQMIGTPAYMAPEQLRSDRENVDIGVDVYSLGIILYELLAGRHPYGADVNTVSAEALRRRMDPALSPSTGTESGADALQLAQRRGTSPRRLRRELSGDLDTICLVAIHAERSRRYASVGHVIDDLERYLEGRPVLARPDHLSYRLGKLARRHPVWVTIGIGSAALALAGASFLVYHADRLERERDRAVLAESESSRNARTAEAIAIFLEGLFTQVVPGEGGAADATARELLTQGATRIRTELHDQPAVRGRLLRVLGRVHQELGLHEEAKALLVESLAALDSSGDSPATLEDRAESLLLLGTVQHDLADYAGSESTYQRAVTAFHGVHGEEHAKIAEALGYLAVSIQAQGRLEEAIAPLERAIAIGVKLNGEDDPEVAWSRNTLGYIYYKQGRLRDAVTLFEQALASQRRTLGKDHLDVAHSLNNLGGINLALGNIDEAGRHWTEALEMYERIYRGEDHPALARARMHVGQVYLERGDLEHARPLIEGAHETNVRMLGDQHRNSTNSLTALARLRQAQGNLQAAQGMFESALATRRTTLGPEHPEVTEARRNLGVFLSDSGRATLGIPLLQQVLQDYRTRFQTGHPRIAEVRAELGRTLLSVGRAADAQPLLAEAVTDLERIYGVEDKRSVRAREQLQRLEQAL